MGKLPMLAAAAGLAVTALVATSPAQASYHLIRWQDTGFCQIWDEAFPLPTAPWPTNYTRVSATVPTLLDALTVKNGMLTAGACAF